MIGKVYIVIDLHQETRKNQRVRRGLKDNNVSGTSSGTRTAEAPGQGHRVCCKVLGREPGWAVCEARCFFGPGGVNKRNFSKKK